MINAVSNLFIYSCIAIRVPKRDRVGVIIISRQKFVYEKSPESIPSEDKQNLSYHKKREEEERYDNILFP